MHASFKKKLRSKARKCQTRKWCTYSAKSITYNIVHINEISYIRRFLHTVIILCSHNITCELCTSGEVSYVYSHIYISTIQLCVYIFYPSSLTFHCSPILILKLCRIIREQCLHFFLHIKDFSYDLCTYIKCMYMWCINSLFSLTSLNLYIIYYIKSFHVEKF